MPKVAPNGLVVARRYLCLSDRAARSDSLGHGFRADEAWCSPVEGRYSASQSFFALGYNFLLVVRRRVSGRVTVFNRDL